MSEKQIPEAVVVEAVDLLRAFQSHYGSRRPDYDEDDAETWDRIDDVCEALTAAQPHVRGGEVDDAMVDAYLAAQAKAVQAVDDKWGAGGKAASYLHPVREACRAGLTAALATQQPARQETKDE